MTTPPPDVAEDETRCTLCGRPNPVWSAPNDTWNAVAGSVGGPINGADILCPLCFIAAADPERKTIWRVAPADRARAADVAEIEQARDNWAAPYDSARLTLATLTHERDEACDLAADRWAATRRMEEVVCEDTLGPGPQVRGYNEAMRRVRAALPPPVALRYPVEVRAARSSWLVGPHPFIEYGDTGTCGWITGHARRDAGPERCRLLPDAPIHDPAAVRARTAEPDPVSSTSPPPRGADTGVPARGHSSTRDTNCGPGGEPSSRPRGGATTDVSDGKTWESYRAQVTDFAAECVEVGNPGTADVLMNTLGAWAPGQRNQPTFRDLLAAREADGRAAATRARAEQVRAILEKTPPLPVHSPAEPATADEETKGGEDVAAEIARFGFSGHVLVDRAEECPGCDGEMPASGIASHDLDCPRRGWRPAPTSDPAHLHPLHRPADGATEGGR